MSNNCQTLEVTANNTSGNVGILDPIPVKVRLNRIEFHVSGVGSGSFTYFQNYDDGENNLATTCFPLESLVWNGDPVELTGFTDQSVCFDGGELLGLNLFGEGWEIIFDFAVNIDGSKIVREINYHKIETPIYPDRIRELAMC